MLRRHFITGLAASGWTVAGLGAGLPAALAAASGPRAGIRLGYLGNTCEAATFIAPRSQSFTNRGLAARLVPFQSEDALMAALAAGSVDAASMNLPALMTPLERGANVRVVAGLHAGCLRVVARDALEINSLNDLRGKVIATDRLHGPSMNLLSAILRRAAIDPQHDVAWRVFSGPDLEAALDAKAVTCVATSDPLGYILLSDHKVEPYLDSSDGGFSCGSDIAAGHHCFLALSGSLVDKHPERAANVTRAYLDATGAIGHGVGPAAVAEAAAPLDADLQSTLGMLSSYDWTTSTDLVLEELELTARDFRRAGLLPRNTDPEKLAERGFADVLHA